MRSECAGVMKGEEQRLSLSIGHTAPGEDMKEPDNKNASKMKRGTCGNTVEF